MDYEAGEYQKLAIKQYPARALRETAEGRYWKRFKAPVVAQQVTRIPRLLQEQEICCCLALLVVWGVFSVCGVHLNHPLLY